MTWRRLLLFRRRAPQADHPLPLQRCSAGLHGLPLIGHADWNDCLNLNCFSTDPSQSFQTSGSRDGRTAESVMIAECMAGRPEHALEYYRLISPAHRESLQEIHRMEPYVYSQMIAGKAAPRHGEAKNSWLTGTAAWNFIAVSQWLLGIRPDFDGLRVEP